MDLSFSTLSFILISIVVLWVRFRKQRLSIFKRNGIPGPEPNFWWGNCKDIFQKRDACVQEYVEKYGNIVGIFVGLKPFLIVTDQDLMRQIQVKEANKFMDKDSFLKDAGIPQPEIMKSMSESHGEEWKKKRSLVSPSFSTSKLKRLMPILNEAVNIFMEKVEKASRKDYINIVKIIKNLTLDIITKAGMGIDTGVQHEVNSKILDSAKLFFAVDTTHILPLVSLCFPEFEPLPTKLRNINDTLKYMCGFPSIKTILIRVKEVMDYRRKFSQRREDMLQNLMDEKADIKKLLSTKTEDLIATYENDEVDKPEETKSDFHLTSNEHVSLSDSAIIGTAAFLLVAGFDTTSVTLSHLAFYLAKYQEIQDKLREEINYHLKGKDIGYEDLSKFTYLEQVILEILRLHSTSMFTINRIVNESFVYNNMTIPKGVTIIIPSCYLHKNPKYWPEPEKFQPDRFSPENKANINPCIYQPFGNGPRNCVGMRFAQVVMKRVLARLIQSYKIKNYGNEDIEMKYSIFLDQPMEVLVKLEPIIH